MSSKFAAWTPQWKPPLGGINLQTMRTDPQHQSRHRVYLTNDDDLFSISSNVHTVPADISEPAPGWDPGQIADSNPNTVWSSKPLSQNATVGIAFWHTRRNINTVCLQPRRENGKAVAFPRRFTIHAESPTDPPTWEFVKECVVDSVPDLGTGQDQNHPYTWVNVSLDSIRYCGGILVTATELTTDDGGTYRFQLAGAKTMLRRRVLVQPEAEIAQIAKDNPNALFFLDDEPDAYGVTADVYAREYLRFIDAVKQGSQTARVSPGGFTFANEYNGLTGVAYARQFFLVVERFQVDELRFHQFYGHPDSIAGWWGAVDAMAAYSESVQKPMVLGSFGAPAVPDDFDPDGMAAAHAQAMSLIKSDPRIVQAVWWSYDWPIPHEGQHLVRTSSNGELELTRAGQVFVSNM